MAWDRKLVHARERLDKRLQVLQPTDRLAPPPKGWIRAIRNAIGMSAAELGKRVGVRSQSIDDMEKAEAKGSISLDTLRRVGRAMDCTLVYALVPNNSLKALVETRAQALAHISLAGVAHTMALEDQAVTAGVEQQVADYVIDHISERDLWSSR